jgi:arabinogalactan endo-1,4-beta-galactosidase
MLKLFFEHYLMLLYFQKSRCFFTLPFVVKLFSRPFKICKKVFSNIRFLIVMSFLLGENAYAQDFYFGADQSYVNEMEDCGVVYMENNAPKDIHQIFKDHGCNLVRLRLWHTPEWYDGLNQGFRYSNLTDVKKAIRRVHERGMHVLLDFHLSDNWADPGKQIVPMAWQSVVNNLPVLQDSLYQYIYYVLRSLEKDDLIPEMVQIGNETNKEILLSPEDNATWRLDFDRNAPLFNTAFKAIRDIESEIGRKIKIAVHFAGPDHADWLLEQFTSNGITDFDVLGVSYYWAWHKPISIEQTGDYIAKWRNHHPEKEVMIFETGYIWTNDFNDQANNTINEVHPDYSPPSPENQKRWLVDLTRIVMEKGAAGVIYWEPSWVSSTCFTQWGHGSHQEHATFFDFNNNLIPGGGIEWMEYDYDMSTSSSKKKAINAFIPF